MFKMVFSEIFKSCRIRKTDKGFARKLVFFFNIRNNFQSKFKKILLRDIDLLLTVKKGSSHHVLIRDFNTFMYNQTLHRGRKHFWLYCLQFLSAAQILERHNNDCFEINGKQKIKMARKGETGKSKKYLKNKSTIHDLF